MPELPAPPCHACDGRCCQTTDPTKPFAVVLDDVEASAFPAAVTIDGVVGLPYVSQRCVHLQLDGRCGIYLRRPQRCRDFNCVSGYRYGGSCARHSFLLRDHPDLVQLVELHCPDYVKELDGSTRSD